MAHLGELSENTRELFDLEEAMRCGDSAAQLEPSQLTREALRGLASHVVHERDFRRKQRRELVSTEQRLLDAVLAGSGGDEAALHSFVESWRSLFVQTLRPTHLPAGWRTDHRRIKATS